MLLCTPGRILVVYGKLFKVGEVLQGMAAAFIHYFLGLGIAHLFGYTGLEAAIVGGIGVVQDFDFVSFFFYKHVMKSRFSRLIMHRGITHTVVVVVGVPAVVVLVSPWFALLVLVNFGLHLFCDYVTAWGVSPFLPFSDKRYSLGLMTIFDAVLTVVSAGVGVAGVFGVNVVWPFAAFFGYILLRVVLKKRLGRKGMPVGNFTYVFCYAEDDYTVGKVDVLGREETISVKKFETEIDPSVIEMVQSKIEGSMVSHFVEYPVYGVDGSTIRIKDARSYLFPKSGRVGVSVFFDVDQEILYMEAAGRRIELE
jgi:membrane-bound metal-dependent hydrolase YbcI (DUF457 family)